MAKFKSQIPNFLSFICLGLGTLAIYINITTKDILMPVLLIALSALLDRYDGKLARYLDAESALGKQLDSFNDFLSFGIAPLVLLCHMSPFNEFALGYVAMLLYMIAGTYRLARFNVSETSHVLQGLPISFAAISLSSAVLAYAYFPSLPSFFNYLLFAFILLISGLMIANFQWEKR